MRKKIIVTGAALLLLTAAFAQVRKKTAKPVALDSAVVKDKYHDNIDDRMKGPHGEVIYIGTNGGRYYLKNGKKIYVPLRKKK